MKEHAINSSRHRGKLTAPKCTACSCVIDINNPEEVMQHPLLRVLLCSPCYTKYDQKYKNDTNSRLCLWCVEKGDFSCKNCGQYLCTECIERIFGLNEVNMIDRNNWTCYVCDPAPLESLVNCCEGILDMLDEEDSDEDGVSLKELNKMCWLEHLMENYRRHLEETCDKLYHLKYKLRHKRALFENQTQLDKEYMSLFSPLCQDVFKNTKYFSETLNEKQNALQPKNKNIPVQCVSSIQRNQVQMLPEIPLKPKIHVSALYKNVKETHIEANNPSVSTHRINMVSSRIKRSVPNPTTLVSPDTKKKLNQILKNQNIVVSNAPKGIKRKLTAIEDPLPHKIIIKEEPESPPNEEDYEDDSLLPPVPKPTNMKFSRVKHSGNRNYNFTNSYVPKPVAKPEPVLVPVQIKAEPIDDSEEEMLPKHNFQGDSNDKFVLLKQEPVWNDSHLKSMESEEDNSPIKSSFSIIEELKNRKELSIQSTNLVTVKDVQFYGSNTNYSMSRTMLKKEGQVITQLPNPLKEQLSGVSGVIDLLKACEPSNPMMVMMSEDEDSDENDYLSSTNNKSFVEENLLNVSKSVRSTSKDALDSSSSEHSTQDRKIICNQCGLNLLSQEELKNHISKMHTRKIQTSIYMCNYCDKPFKTKASYDNHMKLHNQLSEDDENDAD